MKGCVSEIQDMMILVWEEKKKHNRKPVFLVGIVIGNSRQGTIEPGFVWFVFKKMHLVLGKLRVEWQQGF